MFDVNVFTQSTVSVEDGISIVFRITTAQGIGDFNGDGYRDFVIHHGDVWGQPTELGTIYVINGSASFGESYNIEDAALQIDSSVSGNEFAREILPKPISMPMDVLIWFFSSPLAEYPMSKQQQSWNGARCFGRNTQWYAQCR